MPWSIRRGLLASIAAWWQGGRVELLIGGVLLGAVVPFTLLVILPTNNRLLAPELDPGSAVAERLLRRWGALHAVRSALGTLAFGVVIARDQCSPGGRPRRVRTYAAGMLDSSATESI